MTWTCEQIEARLSDYLDGLLEPAETQSFVAHVEQCAHCAPLLAGVSGLLRGLHGLPPIAEPPRLVYAILDKTLGPRETLGGWRVLLGWLRGVASLRFGYGMLSVAATFLVILTASGFNWKHPRFADLSPVNIYRAADRQAHLVYARSSKFVSDLRVVYEIQSRLRSEPEIQTAPESTVPESSPQKQPGVTDGPKHDGPREQNRANGIRPEMTELAACLMTVSEAGAQ